MCPEFLSQKAWARDSKPAFSRGKKSLHHVRQCLKNCPQRCQYGRYLADLITTLLQIWSAVAVRDISIWYIDASWSAIWKRQAKLANLASSRWQVLNLIYLGLMISRLGNQTKFIFLDRTFENNLRNWVSFSFDQRESAWSHMRFLARSTMWISHRSDRAIDKA